MDASLQANIVVREMRKHELDKAISEKKSLDTIKDYYQVNLSDNISEQPAVLTIKNTPVGSLGDFTLITGKAKSRKTFFVGLLVASFFSDDDQSDIMGMLPEGKNKIAFFDTEQSEAELLRAGKRIVSLVGYEPRELNIYHLRPLGYKHKRQFITDVLRADTSIGLVIIDGVRDLLTDINNPDQASNLSEWILELTSNLNIHLITVLHQNKGDNNSRGHLGTELNNKASNVISVSIDSKDKFLSIVSAEFMRGKEFESFAFRINEEGLPYLVDDIPQDNKPRSINPESMSLFHHKELLEITFGTEEVLRYAELWKGLKKNLTIMDMIVGDNTSKKFLKYYQDNDLILKNGLGYKLLKPV